MPFASKTKLIRPASIDISTARLILAVGSRAGLAVPIQTGYYLIGRHEECQIRPKSRSVSRHHCLILHREETGLSVLDLSSTTGTHVNGKRLVPRDWEPLSDGDMIRCGKVQFQVSMDPCQPIAGSGFSREQTLQRVSARRADGVADLLGFEDRSGDCSEQPVAVGEQVDEAEIEFETEFNYAEFEDSIREDPCKPEPAKSSAKVTTKPKIPIKIPKSRRQRRSLSSTPAAAFQQVSEQGWPMIGAVALAIAMVALLGLKAYQTYAGPEVRVIRSID
ncbi:MAG: FHA domain-containing protein [Rubripirellula sp.]